MTASPVVSGIFNQQETEYGCQASNQLPSTGNSAASSPVNCNALPRKPSTNLLAGELRPMAPSATSFLNSFLSLNSSSVQWLTGCSCKSSCEFSESHCSNAASFAASSASNQSFNSSLSLLWMALASVSCCSVGNSKEGVGTREPSLYIPHSSMLLKNAERL